MALYDTADVFSPVAGAQAWGTGRIGPLDVGGHLQLSLDEGFRPRFVGGGALVQLRLHLDDGWFVAGALSAELVDAFTWRRSRRAPLLLVTFGVPVSVELVEGVFVWVRPAVGGASEAWVYTHGDLVTPRFATPYPVVRLTYGASYDFGFVTLYGASSTSLPFGGAFLSFGLAVPL